MATGFFSARWDSPGFGRLASGAGTLIALLDQLLRIHDTEHGWEKVFTGTNVAVYRPRVGLRFYFRVDDTQSQVARVRCYESMTDVNTGVNPFPTLTQVPATDYVWAKNRGSSADGQWAAVVTPTWLVFANAERCRTDALESDVYFVGEPPGALRVEANDPWAFLVRGRVSSATYSGTHLTGSQSWDGDTSGLYAARNPAGGQLSVPQTLMAPAQRSSWDYAYGGVPWSPLAVVNRRQSITHPRVRIRRLPYLYGTPVPGNPRGGGWSGGGYAYQVFDEFGDSTTRPGATLILPFAGAAASTNGIVGRHWALELSDTDPEVP